jgi:ribosomal protein S18 acetylase RimI-like enzyme
MTFEVFQIPHDDESARSWLERVKAFRLLSLQTAPESFLSTYASEVAFTDDIWYGRLTNPSVATFVALQSGRVVGSLALIGPLAHPPEDLSPLGNPWVSIDRDALLKEPENSYWRINGMFTLPEVRGQGIAKALIEKAKVFGCEQAALSGKGFVGSIAVDADNLPAKALYKKCGFVTIKEEPLSHGSSRTVLLMKYTPEIVVST